MELYPHVKNTKVLAIPILSRLALEAIEPNRVRCEFQVRTKFIIEDHKAGIGKEFVKCRVP